MRSEGDDQQLPANVDDEWRLRETVSPASCFAEYCARGELAYQVGADGAPVFPPRLAQPGSGARLRWTVSAGLGTVYATTVVRRRDAPPYNIALVDLDEGFRMMSRVEGIPPESVRIGMRVEVHLRDGLPLFVAVG